MWIVGVKSDLVRRGGGRGWNVVTRISEAQAVKQVADESEGSEEWLWSSRMIDTGGYRWRCHVKIMREQGVRREFSVRMLGNG